jgi:predicted nucleic acid-binding protein
MVLVDTSVWIEHFRVGGTGLAALLNEGSVLTHPFVMGEIACGHLKHRAKTLVDLERLPKAISATHSEVMRLLEDRQLWGRGVGWVDAHLLASALLSNCRFWTLDAKLNAAAAAAAVKLHRV